MFWNKRAPTPEPLPAPNQTQPGEVTTRDLAQREAFNTFAAGLDATDATKKLFEICLSFSAQEHGRETSIEFRKGEFERALTTAMLETLRESSLLSDDFKDSKAFRRAVSANASNLAVFLAHQSGPDETASGKRKAEQAMVLGSSEVKEIFATFGKMFFYCGACIHAPGAPPTHFNLVEEALIGVVSDMIKNRKVGDTGPLRYEELIEQLKTNHRIDWARW